MSFTLVSETARPRLSAGGSRRKVTPTAQSFLKWHFREKPSVHGLSSVVTSVSASWSLDGPEAWTWERVCQCQNIHLLRLSSSCLASFCDIERENGIVWLCCSNKLQDVSYCSDVHILCSGFLYRDWTLCWGFVSGYPQNYRLVYQDDKELSVLLIYVFIIKKNNQCGPC